MDPEKKKKMEIDYYWHQREILNEVYISVEWNKHVDTLCRDCPSIDAKAYEEPIDDQN